VSDFQERFQVGDNFGKRGPNGELILGEVEAEFFARVVAEFNRLGNFNAEPPIHLADGPSGRQFAYQPSANQWFYAKLRGSAGTGTSPYGYDEQQPTSGGGFTIRPGGRASSTGAYETKNFSGLGGKVVQLWPGSGGDYRFQFMRQLPGAGGGCTGAICVQSVFCAGAPPAGMFNIRVSGPGGYSAFGSLDSTGKFCFTPGVAGIYTITGTTTSPNYTPHGTVTVNYTCAPITVNFQWDDRFNTNWPPASYVVNPCCSCCVPFMGRPAAKIKKTLSVTFTGPFGVFGNYAGVPISLTLAADSATPSGCNWSSSSFLHWTSGCIAASGSWGACYYNDDCNVHGVFSRKRGGGQVFYNSCQIDLWQFQNWSTGSGQCYRVIQFANFWGAHCTNSPLPTCPAGSILKGHPVCEIACAFGDGTPAVTAWYPLSVCWLDAAGPGPGPTPCEVTGSGLAAPICYPVSDSVSGLMIPIGGGLSACDARCAGDPCSDYQWGWSYSE
jgi:hypothetical protein